MARFTVTARTARGERVTSDRQAESLPALAAALAADGAAIETVREAGSGLPRIRGIPFFEVTGIYRQIASSIEAGLPLYETLEMLSGESRNARLKSLLYFLKSQVGEGVPLSEAMSRFPAVFPSVHIAIVRAGEESGRLGPALDELAEQAETFSNMNRRFASALVYPTVVSVAAVALLNGAFFAIVPRWKGLFGDLGVVEFPTLTSVIFFVAKLALPVTLMLLLAVLLLVILILSQRKAASGRMWLDTWKLRVPMVGQIVEKAALARFSGTLGLLLDAGVELPRAVNLAAAGAGNRTVEQLFKNISAEVELGSTLSESIDRTGGMPATLAWRLGVGEETGALPDALLRMSRLYARQVDSLVTSLAGFLEPVLIVVLGTGVAMVVLGLFIPLAAIIRSLTDYSF